MMSMSDLTKTLHKPLTLGIPNDSTTENLILINTAQ